jgi:predicted transcriptional regulator
MKLVTSKTKTKVSSVRFSLEQNRLIDLCARLNCVPRSRIIDQAINEFFE